MLQSIAISTCLCVAAYTVPFVDCTVVLVWRVLSWIGCRVVLQQLMYVIYVTVATYCGLIRSPSDH